MGEGEVYYLLIFLAALGIVGMFCVNKLYQVNAKDGMETILIRNILSAGLTCLLFLAINGFSLRVSWFTAGMCLLMTVVSFASGIVGFKGYVKGSVSIFTMFQMQGGMLLPFFYGLWYGNEMTVAKGIGILVMIVSLLLPVLSDARRAGGYPKGFWALCGGIFLLNGLTSILSYIHQNSDLASSVNSLMIYNNLFVLLGSAAWAGALRLTGRWKRGGEPLFGKNKTYIGAVIVASTVLNAVSYFLQLVSASHLPAVALYPMVTGSVVVFTAVAERVFYKVRLSRLSAAGIAMTFGATLLFLF